MSNIKNIHELYHKKTTPSLKVIKDKNFTYRLILDVINRYINQRFDVLDIGCGAGSLSFYLASKGNHVTGIDISEKAIKECVKSLKSLDLNNAEFLQSEFPEKFKLNKKFDGIIFTEVIEHLENDQHAVKKIRSLLQDDGVLILSTPSIHAPLHRLSLTKKFDKEVGHLRRYDVKNLKKLLQDNGFKIIYTKKTEGIIRNFLFVNPYAGKLVRFLNYSSIISDIATTLDNISLKLFGESNYIIVARKKTK